MKLSSHTTPAKAASRGGAGTPIVVHDVALYAQIQQAADWTARLQRDRIQREKDTLRRRAERAAREEYKRLCKEQDKEALELEKERVRRAHCKAELEAEQAKAFKEKLSRFYVRQRALNKCYEALEEADWNHTSRTRRRLYKSWEEDVFRPTQEQISPEHSFSPFSTKGATSEGKGKKRDRHLLPQLRSNSAVGGHFDHVGPFPGCLASPTAALPREGGGLLGVLGQDPDVGSEQPGQEPLPPPPLRGRDQLSSYASPFGSREGLATAPFVETQRRTAEELQAAYMSLALAYREGQSLSRRVLREPCGASPEEHPSVAGLSEEKQGRDLFLLEEGPRTILPFFKPSKQPGEKDPSIISTRAAKGVAQEMDLICSVSGAGGAEWYRSELRKATRRERILPTELWSAGKFKDTFYGRHITPKGEIQPGCARRQADGRAMILSSVMFDHFNFPRTPEKSQIGKRLEIWL